MPDRARQVPQKLAQNALNVESATSISGPTVLVDARSERESA